MPTPAELRDPETGKLPAYAWPGGYQITYLCADGGELCPDCANGENGSLASESLIDHNPDDPSSAQWRIVSGAVFWEGPPILCDHCGARIESAYGDPENPEL